MPSRRVPSRSAIRSLSALLLLSAACGEAPPADDAALPAGDEAAAPAAGAPAPEAAAPAAAVVVAGGPPPGRYVCRQYTTTMGYLTLEAGGSYEVSGVRGRYRYDPQSGAMNWEGGSYDEWGWDGTYERVARDPGDGRPDEDVIRIVSESDGLKIDCFRMTEG